MNDKEIKMIIQLAKRLKHEGRSKEKALKTFVSAGILNENGDFTKPYHNLKNVITERKI
jgi:hypothetical protein